VHGKMRFCKQAQAGDSASLGKPMPVGFADGPQIEIVNDALEERLQCAQVSKRGLGAAVSFDDPLNSVHPRTRYG